MKLAITGVNGFIGRHLAMAALGSGIEVIGIARRVWVGPPYVPLSNRVLAELPCHLDKVSIAGADAVIHLAVAPQSADPATVEAVNVLGTRWLFETAAAAGVERFIFVSSQSAHEAATSAYGRSKFRAEEYLRAQTGTVVVRPGLVIGDGGLVGRVTKAAAKLRFFPVIGGESAVAQPISVHTLCEALLNLAQMSDPPQLVELADPQPVHLGTLIRTTTKRAYGVDAKPVTIPLRAARLGATLASRLRLPSPITPETVQGIESFRRMDTANDLARFAPEPGLSADGRIAIDPVEPRRVLLVGTGRIGLVHALTAMHHADCLLVGACDLDARALGRLRAVVGPSLRGFTSLEEAITEAKPDCAIVATPPSSHVALANQLLSSGIDVLVEKPIAATEDDLSALQHTVEAERGRYVGTGYLAGLLPHVAAVIPELESGRFGQPASFEAHAFVTRIEGGAAEERKMWEVDPKVSGGGALVNLGVHVLAMLDVLLGPASANHATLVFSPGRAVEDGAMLELEAGGISGTFATAWHLRGFDMPENHLLIETSKGRLYVTTSCAAFLGEDDVWILHQTDVDPGFDLAPLDAGGAFWVEQHLLAKRESGANSLDLAARIETLISGVYRDGERVHSSFVPGTAPTPTRSLQIENPGVLPDLRSAPDSEFLAWDGPAVLSGVQGGRRSDERSIVVLPDAPGHFRTLTNRGPKALIEQLGLTSLAGASLGISPLRGTRPTGRVWEAMLLLLRAELKRIPHGFRGTLLIDAYMVDLATAVGTFEPILAALDDLAVHCSQARIGIEVNAPRRLVPLVASAADRIDVVLALSTPLNGVPDDLRSQLGAGTEVINKTGTLPAPVLELAWNEPLRWTRDNERLVVDWPGAPALRSVHSEMLAYAKLAAGDGVPSR